MTDIALPQFISPYLIELINKTGGPDGPIGRQFTAKPDKEKYNSQELIDPYEEDQYEVAPGLIHKFGNRALWLISNNCTSHCRYCMRARKIGNNNKKLFMTDQEIEKVFNYLNKHLEINEIIFSGGEPFLVPQEYLEKIINKLILLQKQNHIKIIRFHTRLPILNPSLIKDWHYKILKKIKNPYILVSINHPLEITEETIKVLNKFRKKANATILGHSVLLKGINDSVETLCELFNKMTYEGIRPYCLYQNDPVPWGRHFTVPFKEAVQLWQQVRPRLSGIAATARFIIESKNGFGKVVVPEAGWDVDYSHYSDFKGKKHAL